MDTPYEDRQLFSHVMEMSLLSPAEVNDSGRLTLHIIEQVGNSLSLSLSVSLFFFVLIASRGQYFAHERYLEGLNHNRTYFVIISF